MRNLNPKQLRFVDEYLIDLNATQAAIRAGYEFPSYGVGYYAYLLCDPRDGHVFYVGKGKGRRVASHALRAAAGKIDNAKKHQAISAILKAGFQVDERIFSVHTSEAEAYAVERGLIERLKDHGLTNIAGGVVSNAELAYEQAMHALDRMWTYEEWIVRAKKHQLEAAVRVFGSTRNCYDAIRSEFMEVPKPC